MIPQLDRYWLNNARIPVSLIDRDLQSDRPIDNLALVDLEIRNGIIQQIILAENSDRDIFGIDLRQKIVLPCFIDMHTHLDKGHIWERAPNLDGTFNNALTTVKNDVKFWALEDVYRRMEFSIKCSYAKGTQAIRTHIDSFGEQAYISLKALQALQKEWQEKITIQPVSLVTLDYYQTNAGIALADYLQEIGGVLGGVAYIHPQLDTQLERIFTLAEERGLDLDFHADENGELDSICLQKIAAAAIRHQFSGKIVCGHCCSLSVQNSALVNQTFALVKEAGIGIVSLPMCNLFLQDRRQGQTPYWRGVTLVKELKARGIPVAFASDNCRDPFYAFGDLDVLEVFNQSVRICHLDTPYENWIDSVTKTPANLIELPTKGRISVGLPANLIIFQARYFSELLSRSQHDRIIIRDGKKIDVTLPEYEELDDLVFPS